MHEVRLIVVEGLDGAGKSTLVSGLVEQLEVSGSTAMAEKLARHSVSLFRELTEFSEIPGLMHQTIVPGPFRHLMYLVEGIAQFHHRTAIYAPFDYIVFDRWYQTYSVYCSDKPEYADCGIDLSQLLPSAAFKFYLRVPPSLALERLLMRGDPWLTAYGDVELRRRLEVYYDRYEERVRGDRSFIELDGTMERQDLLAVAMRHVTGHHR